MRAPPKWLLKRAIEALSDHGLMTLADDLKKYLSPKRGTSARRKVAKSKKAERRERDAAIREEVFDRAMANRTVAQCEVFENGLRCGAVAADWHHVFKAAARKHGTTRDTLAVCRSHHDWFHAGGVEQWRAAEGALRVLGFTAEADRARRCAWLAEDRAALDSMRTGGAL